MFYEETDKETDGILITGVQSSYMEMTEFKEIHERVLLVGVQQAAGDDTEESVRELGDLAQTAGAQAVASVIQKREKIHPAT